MKSRTKNDPREAEVIVVGAGMAGLAAARALAQAGRRVLVIEARNRLGGRVWSERAKGLKVGVEYGAEFVHGENKLLQQTLRRAGTKIRAVPRTMWVRDPSGLRARPDYWDEIVRISKAIPERTAQPLRPELGRQKIETDVRRRVHLFVEGFYAGDAEEISARSIQADGAGAAEAQQRPVGGYGPVVERLAKEATEAGARVRLRTAVRSVRWRRGQVEVTTSAGKFRSRAVVVTWPLGVWRARAVRFRPSIPEKRDAAGQIGWGEVARITLRFRPDGWRRAPWPKGLVREGRPRFGFLSAGDVDFTTWWVPNPQAPLLVGWCGGPGAQKLNRRPAREWRRRAIKSLATILGWTVAETSRWVVDSWQHNWTRDPYTRGGYSYPRAGRDAAMQRLARPVADTVFIAGEASSEEAGTVQGALASGERAAGEVLEVLGQRGKRSR